MVVKPPAGVPSHHVVQSPGPALPPLQAKGAPVSQAPSVANPEAVAKSLQEYKKMQRKLGGRFVKGAAGLFAGNVVFPDDLLDPMNPENDLHYLHLLCAVLGIKHMADYFSSDEQRQELSQDQT